MAPKTIFHLNPDGEPWNHPESEQWRAGCSSCKVSIALDYDGTMVRLMDLVTQLVNYRTGRAFVTKDIDAWQFWSSVGYAREFEQTLDLLDASNLREALQPYDADMAATVRHLARSYERVDVLTANAPVAGEGIKRWVSRHVTPNLPVRTLGRVGSVEKLAEGYKVYIDDNPAFAEHVAHVKRFRSWAEVRNLVNRAARLDGPVLLLANAPWNGEVKDKGAFA